MSQGFTREYTSGSSGGTTLSVNGIGNTPNASGSLISGSFLVLEPANQLFGGVVTTQSQSFSGDKTILTSGSTNIPLSLINTSLGGLNGSGSAQIWGTSQSMAVLTAELNIMPDSWSVAGGVTLSGSGRYDMTSAGGSLTYDFGSVTIGDVYIITFEQGTTISTYLTFGGVTGDVQYNGPTVSLNNIKVVNTTGSLTITAGAGAVSYIRNISVKKVLGPSPAFAYHLASGSRAVELRSDSVHNIAIGYGAGQYMTTPTYIVGNIAIGYSALNLNTLGQGNTAIGYRAMISNTEGRFNVAIGYNALASNKQWEGSIAIGFYALNSFTGVAGSKATTGNIAIGYGALQLLTNGVHNVGVGLYAMRSVLTGNYNTGLGSYAAYQSTGTANTILGAYVALNLTSGGNNNIIGFSSAQQLTTGANNIIIGCTSATTITNGMQNIVLGDFALGASLTNNTWEVSQYKANSGDTQMVIIGYGAWKNTDTDVVTLNGIAIGYRSRVYQSNQAVLGNNDITSTYLKGAVEVRDFSVLAGNTLADSNFPAATTKWSVTGSAMTLGTNKVTFDLNNGSSGTLTQPVANMAITGSRGNRWYRLAMSTSGSVYNTSSFQYSTYIVSITGSTFASTTLNSEYVGQTINNTTLWYFQSKAVPTAFTVGFTGSLTAGSNGKFEITNISLQEVTGGDMYANRYLRSYAGVVILDNIYTPTSSTDPTYPTGSLVTDDTYLWRRNSAGTWTKLAWQAF